MVENKHKVNLENGRFDKTSLADLQAFFADVATPGNQTPIIVHFHGGLVREERGEAIADFLFDKYKPAGAHPLFFVWQAGLFETITHNFKEIAEEDLFPILLERVAQYLKGLVDQEEGERGEQVELPGRFEVRSELRRSDDVEPFLEAVPDPHLEAEGLTDVQEAQFRQLLENDSRLPEAVRETAEKDLADYNEAFRKDLEKVKAETEEGARDFISIGAAIAAAVRIAARCATRFANGRDHGFYPTIVEEIARELKGDWLARTVWKHMKKDTGDAFDGPADTHGGTAFLSELKKAVAAGFSGRIILVGHSTGAVYISELLRAAERENIPESIKFEVVFLAPACTYEHFAKTYRSASERISGFRTFAMADGLEKDDTLVPFLYTRSLLYFVSGLCEETVDTPLVGMQRYQSGTGPYELNKNPDIETIATAYPMDTSAWIWSKSTAQNGQKTDSVKHGDFDNNTLTLDSLDHIVRNGF